MIRDFDDNEKVISVAEMREADAYTIANYVPGRELMYRAARGVYDSFDWEGRRTLLFCGGGNNGGDGYALAMIMTEHGHDVAIVRVSDKLSEDGGYYYEKCAGMGIVMVDMADQKTADDLINKICIAKGDPIKVGESENSGCDVVVDCILGTGFSGEVRGSARDAIEIINSMRPEATVISVDINSGMNGDTGEAGLAVESDLTVSIGFLKTGFFKGRAEELIGRLVNVDIGIILNES